VYCRKSRNADKPDTMVMTDPTVRTTRDNYDNLSIWRDPELLSLQVSVEDIQDIRLIGSGAFGVVWLVRYRNAQLLASKRLREDMGTRERVQDFVDEIKLVSRFDHPNVVKFVGAAWSIESDLQALFEYMENGDLRTYLSASYLPRYWTSTKFQLAIDAVEALVYVHSFDPPLVHRDLKSRNVLISAEMRAKLTDFGTTRHRSKDGTMTMGVGTGRWVAPEIISGSTEYDQSADIFSFGVLLTEIDTHNLPYHDAVGPSGNKLEEVAVLQMVANGQLRPTINASCPPTVRDLANLCMSQNPRDRPVAAEIAYVLRTEQKEMSSA
jgi:serine/threonine protein kinase